jgi:integrase/recombinase XerD
MSDLIPVYLSHLRGAGYAPTTIDARRRLLEHADAHLPFGLDQADDAELAEYLGTQGWSRWTRSTYWSHLVGYYSWAVEGDWLTLNPMRPLRRPPAGDALPDPVTDEELAIALERSPRWPYGAAVMLAAYAGLRAGETVQLRREDVTQDQVHVRVGKGGKGRWVDTHEALWAYFRDEPPGPLVRTVTGRRMRPEYLVRQQRPHWLRIGLPRVHLHRFRHWFATALLRGGADIRVVQELLGHSSLTSTQGYTLVVSEQRRLAVRTLPAPTSPQLRAPV